MATRSHRTPDTTPPGLLEAAPWRPSSPLAQLVSLAGFSYDPAQGIIYSEMYPIQRSLGYAAGYDLAALGMSADIHCEPIFFDYGGRSWMIELWKGQYGLETGAEVGVYTRPSDAPAYYAVLDETIGQRPWDPDPAHSRFFQCADDTELLKIQWVLQKNGTALFSRGPERHWWLTGFRWGIYSLPHELTMDVTIWGTDPGMADALQSALHAMGYQTTRNGTGISFEFATPRAAQPPKPPAVLAAVHAADEQIVATYDALHLPSNDPNDLTGPPVNAVAPFVVGRSASFAGTVMGEAVEAAGRNVLAFLVDDVRCAIEYAAQWSTATGVPLAEWVGEVYDVLHEIFTMNFSCAVEIDNVTRPGAPAAPLLTLVEAKILHKTFGTCGTWSVPPPRTIRPGARARMYLKDNPGFEGAEGWADYAFVDADGRARRVRFQFGCPTGLSSNYAQGQPYTTYARIGDAGPWARTVPSGGHPLDVAFVWAGGPAPGA